VLWRLLVRQRAALGLAIAVGLVWTAGKVAVPQLTRLAVDRGIAVGGSVQWWAGLIIIAGLITGIFTATRRYLAFRESRLTEARLREQLFNHILSLHVGYHDRAQTGQLMSRASSDLNQIQAFVVMIPLTVSNIALILAVIVVMVLTDPLLALVALLPLPFVNWTARRFSDRIHPAVLAVQAEQAQLATVVEESVAGVRVVKGFGAEQVLIERLETEADDIRSVSLRAAALRATYLPLMDLLPTLAVVGVLGIGGLQVLNGSLSVGALVAFSFYVALLIWPLRTIGMTVAFAQRAAAALVRVHEVLGTVPAVVDPIDPVSLRPGRSAEIHFDRVGFGYGSTDAVLRDLDLHIDAGASVAIVGATGSGKSTIARLLLRFYDPDHGSITLGGVDLRELRLADVRSAVGVVFEDTLLFSDTVAANIAFANPDADLETIHTAARLAGADEFIAGLAEGYDTLLGERGYSLSGGQRQRIAIARAIVADPQVLVLDDATSAVDPSKEHEIRDAMRTVMAGRTTVIIAHRPATIALADRVVLLDDGQIVASGTDEELRRASPRYREVIAAMDEEAVEEAVEDPAEDPGHDGSRPDGSAATGSERSATGWS
jgi:ATP-binding cassette subfamily B protein